MSNHGFVLVAIVVLVSASGCARAFMQLAPSTAPVEPMAAALAGARVTGDSCRFMLFEVLPLDGFPTAQEAIDKVADDGALVEVVVESTYQWLLIGSMRCILVSGRQADYTVAVRKSRPRPARIGSRPPTPDHAAPRPSRTPPTEADRPARVATPPESAAVPAQVRVDASECPRLCAHIVKITPGGIGAKRNARRRCEIRCPRRGQGGFRSCIQRAKDWMEASECN